VSTFVTQSGSAVASQSARHIWSVVFAGVGKLNDGPCQPLSRSVPWLATVSTIAFGWSMELFTGQRTPSVVVGPPPGLQVNVSVFLSFFFLSVDDCALTLIFFVLALLCFLPFSLTTTSVNAPHTEVPLRSAGGTGLPFF